MKVSLKPGTAKEGLIRKREVHTIRFSLQMTEEEKAACKAAGILDQHMFNLPLNAGLDGMPITVGQLVEGINGMEARFLSFLDSSAFTDEVKEMLVKLKSAIDAKLNEGDEEFEL